MGLINIDVTWDQTKRDQANDGEFIAS